MARNDRNGSQLLVAEAMPLATAGFVPAGALDRETA
jgi:hypothetical protein